jgi:hypothetical protein
MSLSSDVIGEELCAERLLKSSCLGFGFEGLGFRYECVGRFCGVSIWAWKALARRYLGGRRGRPRSLEARLSRTSGDIFRQQALKTLGF